MNKVICEKCLLEQGKKDLIGGYDSSSNADFLNEFVKEKVRLLNHNFSAMGFEGQPCPFSELIGGKATVKEPPSNCPYLLEHTVTANE